ncbi:uncharacterized protein PHALS_13706 [Plasmopara halstedii]|uniref:Uncharacterized protein n=1 Tax=Plasmopara halstedii TaxID=4781 RepID=A0A0P1AQI9_PLAHL|nr:uncharacterized protein PHALS_13706 [Plasmopara halstedii]CEG43513.1 hypothetical protein PHALS_13706 [Plasmopara halstedii]|eukprot:XP_024579882.1 hypothetical protein PHALS_13706 [Plasmopara halstedii]
MIKVDRQCLTLHLVTHKISMAWHWQQRFDPINVESACQQQIHKIHKSMPFDIWLKEKIRAHQNYRIQERIATDRLRTAAEIDASFRDWLRRKRMIKKQKNADDADTSGSAKPKPYCKPPSLHVNPKLKKGSTRTAEHTSVIESKLRSKHSEFENQQAYNAWLARIRVQDRVRRLQRRDELIKLEQQQREKHRITWRKKLAVCAYSTQAL